MDKVKRNDQIRMLETCLKAAATGIFEGGFYYQGCEADLFEQGLLLEDGTIATAGMAALFLLGKGPDPTISKSFTEVVLKVDRTAGE